jgi:hypothetical protein
MYCGEEIKNIVENFNVVKYSSMNNFSKLEVLIASTLPSKAQYDHKFKVLDSMGQLFNYLVLNTSYLKVVSPVQKFNM